MSVEEHITNLLVKRGLLPTQAEDVMVLVKGAPGADDMARRWQDDVSGYDEAFMNFWWDVARRQALEWLDQHKPKHFARHLLR